MCPSCRRRQRDVPAFLRDGPEKTALDDVARLIRRLRNLPTPGQLREDPDEWAAAFATTIVRALEFLLYGALVGQEPVPQPLRPAAERLHRDAVAIAESLPASVKRGRATAQCQAGHCRGDGRISPDMQAQLRIFCDRCIY